MNKWRTVVWTLCGLLLLALLAIWAVREGNRLSQSSEVWDYKPHLTLGETTYWLSAGGTESQLPEGYEACAQITEVVNGLAKGSGQANGHAVGTPVYQNPAQPGWVFVPTDPDHSRWVRYTVIELQKSFLRYDGILYLRAQDVPYEIDADTAFSLKRLEPVEGELFLAAAETVPTENGGITRGFGPDARLLRDPKKPELLILRDGTDVYTAYVTLESLGLDYSAWEWR